MLQQHPDVNIAIQIHEKLNCYVTLANFAILTIVCVKLINVSLKLVRCYNDIQMPYKFKLVVKLTLL